MTRTNENELVERLKVVARASAGPAPFLPLGIGDDAALFVPRAGYRMILTCDWFLEGTHFLRRLHPADSVGWKCLARAVSDIAAMGGQPRCFLLSLALPQTHLGRWLEEFLGGLKRAARRFDCQLAGGDTTRQRDILVNITVVGEVRTGRAVLRSGAKPGDAIFVSGSLGEAEMGLRRLRRAPDRANQDDAHLKKHLYPEPRLALGRWLAENRFAASMMDLSDGLSTDLPRLCAASGVGARIDSADLPCAQAATNRVHGSQFTQQTQLWARETVARALNRGDDYELLFTVRKNRADLFPRSFQGVPLTRVGRITAAKDLVLVDPAGREIPILPQGWDPFRQTR